MQNYTYDGIKQHKLEKMQELRGNLNNLWHNEDEQDVEVFNLIDLMYKDSPKEHQEFHLSTSINKYNREQDRKKIINDWNIKYNSILNGN